MQSHAEAVSEVLDYIAPRIRADVDAEALAIEIVNHDQDTAGGGHGEVTGYYTLNGNPLVVSFEPAEIDQD